MALWGLLYLYHCAGRSTSVELPNFCRLMLFNPLPNCMLAGAIVSNERTSPSQRRHPDRGLIQASISSRDSDEVIGPMGSTSMCLCRP